MKTVFKKMVGVCLALVMALAFAVSLNFLVSKKQPLIAEAATAPTPKIYWGVSGNTLTFSANSFTGATQFDATTLVTGSDEIPWLSYKSTITTVNFSTVVAPKSTAYWFTDFNKLTTINNFSLLNASNVVQAQCMFNRCSSLAKIDFTNFITAQLTNIRGIFRDCSSLEQIDISNFDFSKIVDLGNLFEGCSKLKSVVLPECKSPDLKYTNHMFYNCSSLTMIDLSNFDVNGTTIVTDISAMFKDTPALQKIKLSDSLAKCIALSGRTEISTPLYDVDNTTYNTESELTKGGGYFTSPHSHSFKTTSQVDATCAVDGSKVLTCSEEFCGKTKTETIPATGNHTYVAGVAVAPTCTEKGYTPYACSVCGDSYNGDEVDALGHNWGAWHETVTPTEQTEGEEQRECQSPGCGVKETQPIPKLDHVHDWDSGVQTKAPTCAATGEKTYTCTTCQATKTEEVAIDPAAHDYSSAWSKDANNHWHECANDHTHKTAEAPHDWNGGVITKQPTATAKGEKTFTCTTCGQTKVEQFAAGTNSITGLALQNWTYGDPANTPSATAIFGTIKYTYSDSENGTYSALAPTYAGTYWVKAIVEADPNGLFPAAEAKTSFEIEKRRITVEINGGSSEQGKELEALTATVTGGSIVNGDTNVYTLTTNADKTKYGIYKITGVCANDNYDITFVEGVYIVSKRADDPNGGGSIDLPTDANVEFKVTQSKTSGDYSELEGMKIGYWAQLWERKDDGTLGDEYTENLNCVLTLKIPTEIIEAIRGGEEINRNKIAAGLGVYYVTNDGLEQVKAFNIAQREDESWIVKFNYNSKFRAEVVFNAPEYEQPEPKEDGTPWWVWLIVGLGGATLITVIIVAVVLAKKRSAAKAESQPTVIMQGSDYDDAALKAQLAEQNKRLEDLENRDDGGFNDIYTGDV